MSQTGDEGARVTGMTGNHSRRIHWGGLTLLVGFTRRWGMRFGLALLTLALAVLTALAAHAWLAAWQQKEQARAELFWNGYVKLYVEQSGGWDGLQERLEKDRYMFGGDADLSINVYQGEEKAAGISGEYAGDAARKIAIVSQGERIGYTQASLAPPAYAGYLTVGLPLAAALAIYAAGSWHMRRMRAAAANAKLVAARRIESESGVESIASHGLVHAAPALEADGRRGVVGSVSAWEAGAEAAAMSAIVAVHKLLQRNEKLETVRRTMVADLAHELRTPISIMRTQLDHAIQNGRPLSLQKTVVLHDETLRLTRLVREMQELSLAESGHLPLVKSWFSLSKLAEEVLETLAAEAEERNVGSRLSVDMDVRVYGDQNRIRQIVINLIGNAFQHARGHVDIKVTLEGNMAMIAVSDDGWGMEEEERERVFERFYRGQAQGSHKGRSSGLGLGLAIVKEFAAAHQGSAEVSSSFGEGACFKVRLPVFAE